MSEDVVQIVDNGMTGTRHHAGNITLNVEEIKMIYQGSCHCGAVRFKVEASEDPDLYECNCSICNKTGYIHLMVGAENFELISGEDVLTSYSFNTGIATHRFCSICGIKSFYTPRSNPDGVSVNVRCLNNPPAKMQVMQFDGQNWEQNVEELSHQKKKEPDQN